MYVEASPLCPVMLDRKLFFALMHSNRNSYFTPWGNLFLKTIFSKISNRKWHKTEPVMVMEQDPRRLDTNKLIDALDKRVLKIEKRTQEGFDNILSKLKEMETKTNKHQCPSNQH